MEDHIIFGIDFEKSVKAKKGNKAKNKSSFLSFVIEIGYVSVFCTVRED